MRSARRNVNYISIYITTSSTKELVGVNGTEHRQLRLLALAARAFEAGGEVGEVGVAVHPRDVDCVHRPRRAAVGALDLQGAAEADEIEGRADLLVGHPPPLAW